MKPTDLPLVAVLWNDAHGTAAVPVDEGTVHEHHKPVQLVTIGWPLRWDEEGISLANEIDEDGEYRGHTFILRSMVADIWRVSKNPFVKRWKYYPESNISAPKTNEDAEASV